MESLKENCDGYALIIVLWTLVILSVIFVNLFDEVQLNSFLIRNNLDKKKIYNTSLSGIIMGIDKLKSDNTEYDIPEDEWNKNLEGTEDQLEYKVEIEDIGSKLNINYTKQDILSKLDWWNEEVEQQIEEKIAKQGFVINLLLIKDILGEDYSKAIDSLTTYGYFNLNSDDLNKLRRLLEFLELNSVERNLIYGYLNKERRAGRRIKEIKQLETLYLKGLSERTLNSIRPYLAVNSNLNINFISEDLLEVVLKGLNINLSYKEKIIKLRQREGIKELSEISTSQKNLLNYFTVSSKLFLITSRVFSNDGKPLKEIKCIVERNKDEDDNWKIKILKWDEE
ncbi:type II secretion system minor pseudopilin [Orenia marismortui]|uniref:general secretion pathway protein GspK n=1 Tax=Orenia marismortui TaxID=46469 RepID=UPI000380E7BF|nr:type II secretion system protein GspK [Orenia marismortui]